MAHGLLVARGLAWLRKTFLFLVLTRAKISDKFEGLLDPFEVPDGFHDVFADIG